MKKILLLGLLAFVSIFSAHAQLCNAVYADDDIVLTAIDRKLYRSTDNGNTFTKILPEGMDSVDARCFAKINGTIVMGTYAGDHVYISKDNGLTWTAKPEFFAPVDALAIEDKVFVGGAYKCIVSTDDGDTWSEISGLGFTWTIESAGDKLYHSFPRYSSNLGETWEEFPNNPLFGSLWAVGFTNFGDTLLMFSNASGGVALNRTYDNGESWETIGSLSAVHRLVKVGETLYITSHNSFQKSTDHGLSWVEVCDLFVSEGIQSIGAMSVHNDDIWIASGNGLLRYSITDETCELIEINETTGIDNYYDQSKNNLAVHPNPAKEIVTIENLVKGSSIKIFDITGAVVYHTIVDNEQITINTSNFTNGNYLIQVENKGAMSSSKLVIRK